MAQIKASRYVVDGNIKFNLAEKTKIKSRVRADKKVPQVILAGIIAKLHRDKIMRRLDKHFPNYFWKLNKGYGTKKHREAILVHGPSQHHRLQWLQTWSSKAAKK